MPFDDQSMIQFADVVRIALFSLFAFLIFRILGVLFSYVEVFHYRIKYVNSQFSLLRHIITIGLSYIMAVVFLTIEIFEKIGDPPSWRIPIGFLVFSLGIKALNDIRKHLVLELRSYNA